MAYMRTSRAKTPVIYGPDETFPIGGSKVVRQSDTTRPRFFGAGVTLFEALKAYDQLKAEGIEIRAIDAYSLQGVDREDNGERGSRDGGVLITVEDHMPGRHWRRGQRGRRRRRLRCPAASVGEIPRSGQPDELLDRYGISARHIVEAVKQQIAERAWGRSELRHPLAGTAAASAPIRNIPSNS